MVWPLNRIPRNTSSPDLNTSGNVTAGRNMAKITNYTIMINWGRGVFIMECLPIIVSGWIIRSCKTIPHPFLPTSGIHVCGWITVSQFTLQSFTNLLTDIGQQLTAARRKSRNFPQHQLLVCQESTPQASVVVKNTLHRLLTVLAVAIPPDLRMSTAPITNRISCHLQIASNLCMVVALCTNTLVLKDLQNSNKQYFDVRSNITSCLRFRHHFWNFALVFEEFLPFICARPVMPWGTSSLRFWLLII